jgi:hypothetical protein
VQRERGFTQLWLLPDASGGASLGVTSDENAAIRYDLDEVVGGRIPRRWPGLALRPGQTWQATLPAADLRGVWGRIEARLYRQDRPGTVYRYVTLWIGSGAGQAVLAAGVGSSRSPGGGQSPAGAVLRRPGYAAARLLREPAEADGAGRAPPDPVASDDVLCTLEKQQFDGMYACGEVPWEVWRREAR